MKIRVKSSGNFNNMTKALTYYHSFKPYTVMDKIGSLTVDELKRLSPVRTGQFRAGWGYDVDYEGKNIVLTIYNESHKDVPELPWWIEYGHSVGGTWIEGRNFIKPTIETMNNKVNDILEVTLRG